MNKTNPQQDHPANNATGKSLSAHGESGRVASELSARHRDKVSHHVYSLKANIIFAFSVPFFFLLFEILYTPGFNLSGDSALRWDVEKDFCIPILSAILFVSIALSRSLFILATRKNLISNIEYIVWQVSEIIISGLFSALFLSLYFSVGYFEILPRILTAALGVEIFPYLIYWFIMRRQEQDSLLEAANHTIMTLKSNHIDERDVLKFVDEKGNVRLIVPSEHVICIEAAGNYVTILYEDNGKLVRFALRNTLKAIEGLSNSLIRTHRSYYVNLHHIKLLQKDTSGVFAEIDIPGVAPIPISKNYAADVAQQFSTQA